jgi:hypothetical protein
MFPPSGANSEAARSSLKRHTTIDDMTTAVPAAQHEATHDERHAFMLPRATRVVRLHFAPCDDALDICFAL